MQAIADAAGVHLQTVYLASSASPPEQRRWVRELFAKPDPRRQLGHCAQACRPNGRGHHLQADDS
jgi:hypothetical protein